MNIHKHKDDAVGLTERAKRARAKRQRNAKENRRKSNKRYEKIIQGSRGKPAPTAHTLVQNEPPREAYIHSNKASKETNNLKMKKDSDLNTDRSKTKTTTKNSFNWSSGKQHLMESKIGKRFFNKKGALLLSGLIAGSLVLNRLGSQLGDAPLVTTPRVGQFTSRSAYIPDSYKRGYHDIKEALTDFGSRVHLDKAIKKLVTPFSSTRNGIRTNTAALYNSNIALSMHKNAINHTRY